MGGGDTSAQAYYEVISKEHAFFKTEGDGCLKSGRFKIISRLRKLHSEDSIRVAPATNQ